ncbi:MAG TPA: trypsin-like peptidase domain-containing protein [Myxococcota bacterium]|nr:trypsin-like peptidase domain-containing protein [Myxococcota bacterium]
MAVFRAAFASTVHITTVEMSRDLFSMDVTQVPRGSGSGFIWDDRGHVVTNFHVIQGASGARVTLADQTQWQAELVGAYPDRDLAVLRIGAPREKLKPVAVGTSRDLQVGQKVYAIGNPFGLDQTLTTGIISALNREIAATNERKIRSVIQTDAAINPGNSGGPLLDSAGTVIGINTAIIAYAQGLGFAVPATTADWVVMQLLTHGRVRRARLGVGGRTRPIDRRLARILGLAQASAVEVLSLSEGGPAARAGLRVGDWILSLDGKPTGSLDALVRLLGPEHIGRPAQVTLLRGRERLSLTIHPETDGD